MGERDYVVIMNDVFFCRTDHSQTAYEIIKAFRPIPSPICDRCKTDQEPLCIGCDRLQQHDTTTRNATLEQVIEDYSRELKERIIKSNLPSNCFDRLSLIIHESAESLRTKEQP
jgi:predicted Fe-S protein YdhL (DUF1289 family)